MQCVKCQATVPDESLFCLRCGARLQIPARRAPVNGGGIASPATPVGRRAGPAAEGPVPAAGKRAYTLAFKPLADERLRYRVARFVCESAPAHALSEVQTGLLRGEFATFLALTEAEARATRQRIEALGAHPALWRLDPATTAEMLIPSRTASASASGWSTQKKLLAAALTLLALLLFGIVATRQYFNATPAGLQPGTMPTIGGRP